MELFSYKSQIDSFIMPCAENDDSHHQILGTVWENIFWGGGGVKRLSKGHQICRTCRVQALISWCHLFLEGKNCLFLCCVNVVCVCKYLLIDAKKGKNGSLNVLFVLQTTLTPFVDIIDNSIAVINGELKNMEEALEVQQTKV